MDTVIKPRSQLDYPLDDKSIVALKSGLFTFGTATLSSGLATVNNSKIKSTSLAMVSYATFSGASSVTPLSSNCADGQLTIHGYGSGDTSTVNYLVVF